MNTIRSTWYGWGGLCVAGGGAYYFAKRSINADRAARYEAEQSKQARLRKLEPYSESPNTSRPKKPKTNIAGGTPTGSNSNLHHGKDVDHAGSPSTEASEDAAPVEHAAAGEEHEIRERSVYEAAKPYRSKKGDRFS